MRTLDGKSCPGEHTCTTDHVLGQIASLQGKREKRTLENYCHNTPPTKENRLKQGCPFYDTKPDNVPDSLVGAIEAAELLRRYKLRGVLPPINELSAWEFCAFDTAEEASDQIEAEAMKEATNNTTNTDSPLGKMGEISPTESAMKDW